MTLAELGGDGNGKRVDLWRESVGGSGLAVAALIEHRRQRQEQVGVSRCSRDGYSSARENIYDKQERREKKS